MMPTLKPLFIVNTYWVPGQQLLVEFPIFFSSPISTQINFHIVILLTRDRIDINKKLNLDHLVVSKNIKYFS